jgi:3-oxoacyl-[acyl-carrier protein] reductase
MSNTLQNQSALITGASRGIGESIARRFASEGADVAICSRRYQAVESVAEDIENTHEVSAVPVACDVGDTEAIERLIDTVTTAFGPMDILVNNAGGSLEDADGNLDEVDDDTIDWSIDVNLKGQIRVARELLPSMIEAGGGSMIHMGSVNGASGIGLVAYSSAKSGLRAFSKNIAVDFGHQGIRSNLLVPATIETEARVMELEQTEERNENRQQSSRDIWLDQYPLGRFGRPEEVADAALFLASEQSSFVTGTELVLDGGLTAGLDQRFQQSIYDIEG